MRNRLGQALATATAVLALGTVAACGHDAAATYPAAAAPASGRPVSTAEAKEARDLEVYLQVLRRYLTAPGENSFPDRRFAQIFVLDRAVPGSGEAQVQQAAGDAIPDGTRQRIVTALADLGQVSFVADRAAVIVTKDGCAVVKDDGILITLDPVSGDGDRVEVGINGFVACLGATWLTYVVQYTSGGGWQVTGTTGSMTIA